MNINTDELFKKDAFKNLKAEKLDAIKKFAAQANGRSAAEIIPLFMQFSKDMQQGEALSQQDSDAMLAAIYETLPEPDRSKLTGIIKMLGMMGGLTS